MANRRNVTKALGIAALLCIIGSGASAQSNSRFGSDELIAAAKKEGKVVLYTSNWAENEQPMVAEFNKLFPEITVEIVRATAAGLLTRVRGEASANKLQADIIDLADRTSVGFIIDLFADYAPVNASSYNPGDVVNGKTWPRVSWGWVIGYNSAILKRPPQTWKELVNGKFEGGGLGHISQAPGGSAFVLAMFERQVVEPDAWKKLAAQKPLLFVSSPQLTSALTRGEIRVAPVLTNAIKLAARNGAPLAMILPQEGVPVAVGSAGIAKTAAHKNAAQLYLNWCLSPEGQAFIVNSEGLFSVLKGAPLPSGVDVNKTNLWRPDPNQFEDLMKSWPGEFAKTIGDR